MGPLREDGEALQDELPGLHALPAPRMSAFSPALPGEAAGKAEPEGLFVRGWLPLPASIGLPAL